MLSEPDRAFAIRESNRLVFPGSTAKIVRLAQHGTFTRRQFFDYRSVL
jgi:hypothetical protein